MSLPKEFKIFGELHKVSEVKKVDSQDSFGEYIPDKNKLRIKKQTNPDIKEQTFLHELTHAILHHLSYDELYEDEVFVDQFSKALHQALKTSGIWK